MGDFEVGGQIGAGSATAARTSPWLNQLALFRRRVIDFEAVVHSSEAQTCTGSAHSSDLLLELAVHSAGQGHMPVFDDDVNRRNRTQRVSRKRRIAIDGACHLKPQPVIVERYR